MRTPTIAALLACCANAVVAQQDEPRNAKPPEPKRTLTVYPVQHLGKARVDRLKPWFRAFVGKSGTVHFNTEAEHLLVTADREAHERVASLLQWTTENLPLQFEATVTELYGDAKQLRLLAKSFDSALEDQAAVTKLLRAASRLEGVRFKNFAPKKLRSGEPLVLGDPNKVTKQGEPRSLVIGATNLRDDRFLATIWGFETDAAPIPCTQLKPGQTLVVDDVDGRLILVKYDKVTAERRALQVVPMPPVLLPPGKPRPAPRKVPGRKKSAKGKHQW